MAFTPVSWIASYFGWTQFTPSLPEFYWDVYSAEERVKKICLEIDKLCQYADMLADNINIDHKLVKELQDALANIENIDELDEKVTELQAQANTIETILSSLPSYEEFLNLSDAVAAKIPWPTAPNSRYGTDGQILRTNGDGSTMWQSPSAPTDSQVETYINAWLNNHPEATTTVVDGSISNVKLSNDVKSSIATFGKFVTKYGIVLGTDKGTQLQLMDYDDPNVTVGGYINREGTFVESNSTVSSGFIPVVSGLEYTISVIANFVVTYDYAGNYSGYISTQSTSPNSKFTCDSSVAFVRVPVLANGTARITCNAWFIDFASSNELEMAMEPINKSIEFSPNLFDKNDPDVTIGSYVNTNGVVVENASLLQSGYIRVMPGTHYSATTRDVFVLWYNANKEIIGNSPSGDFTSNGYVVPPSGCTHGRFIFPVNRIDTSQVFEGEVIDGQGIPPYHSYNWARFIDTTEYNEYRGLSGVAFGTSLTYREQTTGGYLSRLRELSEMTWDNQGLGSSTILYKENVPYMLDVILNYSEYSDKDVAILEGFVNDWGLNTGNLLGTWKDTGTATVCGCVRTALNYIFTQNSNITVFLILDHYGKLSTASTAVNSGGQTQYEYYSEIEKIALSLGVRVIREYELSEISELTPQYLLDNIHLNALGAIQSGNAIWNAMKNTSPNVKSS